MTPQTNRQAAATAVPVTLEEMDKLLRRGFRALKPRPEKTSWGEIVYLLTPDDEDPDSVIRVQTSIFHGQEQARGEGEDSIRVTIINTKSNRPIAGKQQRVHRTQNWKDNLRQRIEDAIETFEDIVEERAKAKQIGTVREEQEKFRQEQPQQAQSERDRQIAMLQALSTSRSSAASAFGDMLRWMRRPGALLSPKQLAWAEREYNRIR